MKLLVRLMICNISVNIVCNMVHAELSCVRGGLSGRGGMTREMCGLRTSSDAVFRGVSMRGGHVGSLRG